MVEFYPSFKFYVRLGFGMVMHDNNFGTKENKLNQKNRETEPRHIQNYPPATMHPSFPLPWQQSYWKEILTKEL